MYMFFINTNLKTRNLEHMSYKVRARGTEGVILITK